LGEVFANASAASPPAVYFAKTSPNHPPSPDKSEYHGVKKMRIILLGLVLAIGLTACDTVEDMRDMLDTQEQLRAIIEEEIGVESLVGFNINNDVLIDVTITLNANDVTDRSVSELVRIARSAVKRSFESKPRAIYIQMATTAE
jgi:hypothetical protein